MKNNYYLNKNILEAVSNAIQLALDDFDSEEVQSNKTFNDVVDDEDSAANYQRHVGQKMINQKIFVHELIKRLPGVDKGMFVPFGFVNYKVTGNEKDWPYITSLNKNMAERIRERYGEIFDTKGWTTVSGSHTFYELILIRNDIFKKYHIYMNEAPRGQEAYNQYASKKYWIDQFKGKYNEFNKALELLAYYHQYLKETINFWINQISLSNDGAFIAVMYEVYNADAKKDIQHVEVFSTIKLIGDKGININEENDIKTKQRKFKNYLNKINILDKKVPKLFVPTVINNHAAFSVTAESNTDFDYRLRYHMRANSAYEEFRKQYSMSKTFDTLMYISYTMFNCLYIEDKYANGLYDTLEYNGIKPYILISSKDGKYLIGFYNLYHDYKEYKLIYMIIDNTDYSIMSKEYLKEIEYNPIK